jgi:hypothetical protein
MTSIDLISSVTANPKFLHKSAIFNARAEERLLDKSAVTSDQPSITARDWFALGNRVPYDRRKKEILQPDNATPAPDVVQVSDGSRKTQPRTQTRSGRPSCPVGLTAHLDGRKSTSI